jgi:hypothetical protein
VTEIDETDQPPPTPTWLSEDWWAIWCGAFLLGVSFLAVWMNQPAASASPAAQGTRRKIANPLAPWMSKPGSWTSNPLDGFYRAATERKPAFNSLPGTVGAMLLIGVVFVAAMQIRLRSGLAFLPGYFAIFLLAALSFALAGQNVIKAYNLEYPLWALFVGLIVSNTVGTPALRVSSPRGLSPPSC